ncbi:MAG TPA: subclass B1 metallo-beta-lactamase [Longimicrobiaceae bacterium]|nr:subclass B1 metallo-beta-lactamase [Longimicrobiaceae bacterium]
MFRYSPVILAALLLAGCAPAASRAPDVETQLANDVSVRRIAPGLWVHTTVGRVDGSEVPANGMLLEMDGGSLLVDTGWDERQGAVLLDWARSRGRPVKRAVVTHSHRDRTGGAAAMRRAGVPVVGLAATARLAGPAAAVEAVPGLESAPATVEGAEVFFPGAGHAPDNVVVYFPRQRVLYGGCLVKADTATTVGNVADADVPGWPAVVERVRERYPAARVVVPGHGAVSGPDALRVTRELVRDKGPAALEALRRGTRR